MSLFSPIHHTFGPLARRSDALHALQELLQPFGYRRTGPLSKLRERLRVQFGGSVHLFASGREALFALLKSLGVQNGDEVIVQGYTCVVVPNAIIAAGATAVFADIAPETLSMDPIAVERLVTPRTKAIICQHTFGLPAPTATLRSIADRAGIPLIEDCAHVMPDASGPAEIGKLGHALLFSFGRDKAISGITGGAIINRIPSASTPLELSERQAKDLPQWTVARLLLYPLIYRICLPFYGLVVGKAMLWLAARLGLLLPLLTSKEKDGCMAPVLHRLPAPCAALALAQLGDLRDLNDHRRRLTQFYWEEAKANRWPIVRGIQAHMPLQKFPLFIERAERVRQLLKKKNIHLHDGWTGCVICPEGVDPTDLGYHDGDDPGAELAGEQILSLPTHPTMTLRQAKRLSRELTALLSSLQLR